MEGKVAAGDRECSMCGDIGFPSELFQCKECNFRWQHNYCSRLYPSMGCVNWEDWPVCDWCFGTPTPPKPAAPKPKSRSTTAINLRRSSSVNYEFYHAAPKPKSRSTVDAANLRRSSSSNYEFYQAHKNNNVNDNKNNKSNNNEIKQWDALDYLLEVAQMSSILDGEASCMKRQACSSRRTCARKLNSSSGSGNGSSFKRHHQQKWGFVSETMQLDSSRGSKSVSPRTISSRRYKLLADLC